ncbi:TetR/AcrR family transcriptional regulator [Arthrobacter frigidicola]|nr:TetR/AcrR family transcriptional regulator [Arthrobacter frigidicola]
MDAPVREIAGRAGVGVGAIYRPFPTRADLIIAVYRHQVEACAGAGPATAGNRTAARVQGRCVQQSRICRLQARRLSARGCPISLPQPTERSSSGHD